MTTASLSPKVKSPEFIIYAFERDEVSKGSPVWQALKTLDDEAQACHIADILFKNEKFTRIEVRRKGEIEPVKILDSTPSAMRKLYLMFSGAVFCVVSAALITIYQ